VTGRCPPGCSEVAGWGQACVIAFLGFFRPPHPGSHQPFTDRREYIPVGSTAAVPAADLRDRPLPTGLLQGKSKGSGLRYCVIGWVFFRPPHPGSHQPFTDRREYIPVGSTAAIPAADVRDRPLPTGLLQGKSKGSGLRYCVFGCSYDPRILVVTSRSRTAVNTSL